MELFSKTIFSEYAFLKNMPVLRSDYDINDVNPKEAAIAIVNRIKERGRITFSLV